MGVISTSQIFGLTVRESANDGSDFTNPAADYRRLFLGEDGLLHLKDSAGTVTDVGAGGSGSITASGYTQSTARLLGRTTASSGAIEEISVGSGLSLSAGSLTATGGTTLVSDRVVRTAGDLTTTSTTFVDATGMSITATTGARKVLISVTATTELSVTVPNDVNLDIDVDGARLGGTFGLCTFQHVTGSRRANQSFSWVTAALTAASHTFKLQWRVVGGTGTLYASTTIPLQLAIVELAT